MDRKPSLDSLRGIASVMVFLNHLVLTVVPSLSMLSPDAFNSDVLVAIGRSPLSVIWGGDFGVCIFFVLSGYVLAQFSKYTDLNFLSMAGRRYVRLALPMLASTLLAYVILVFGLFYNDRAALLSHSTWLGAWYQFQPSLVKAVYEGLAGAFIKGESAYNCNLWTMKIELIGSLAVFLIYSVSKSTRGRIIAFAILAILSPGYYPLFAIGALLFEMQAFSNSITTRVSGRRLELIAFLLLILAIWAGGFPASGAGNGISSRWHSWLIASKNAQEWHMAGATMLMMAVLSSGLLTKLLEMRFAKAIGEISFPLYLIQIPLLCSLTSGLLVLLSSQDYLIAAIVAICVSIVAAIAASYLMSRLVEIPSLKFSRQCGLWLKNFKFAG